MNNPTTRVYRSLEILTVLAIATNASHATGASAFQDLPKMYPPGTVNYESISSMPENLRPLAGIARPGEDSSSSALLEQDIRRFVHYRERMRDSSSLAGKIKGRMAGIDRSVLADYPFAGLIPEGPTRQGPWTDFIRVYMRPDATPVFLYESNFVAAGGHVVIYTEFLKETVGETPARLVIKRDVKGRAISELSWTTPKRTLKLSVWGDVSNLGYDKRWLKEIAESLTDP